MYARVLTLLVVAAFLLAFIQSQRYTTYLPLVNLHTYESACYGQILSTAYEDLNGNGRQADNEVGLAGIRLVLRSFDKPWITTTATGIQGTATMALPPGRYALRAVKPSGYRWSTPDVWGIDLMCATIELSFGLGPIDESTVGVTGP